MNSLQFLHLSTEPLIPAQVRPRGSASSPSLVTVLIYVGSETAPADAVADPLLRPCSERSVFWGGVGVGERPVATLALWELP